MNTQALRARLVLKSKKMDDLARALHISKSALYRRMNGTASFNREEILGIIHFLDLSSAEAMQIFFTS